MPIGNNQQQLSANLRKQTIKSAFLQIQKQEVLSTLFEPKIYRLDAHCSFFLKILRKIFNVTILGLSNMPLSSTSIVNLL